MNREQAKKLLPIITAYAEGKEIQIKHASGEWGQLREYDFTSQADRYRIKPESVVVEKWAAVKHEDGRIYTFNSEKGAIDFVSIKPIGEWSIVLMRGTYER